MRSEIFFANSWPSASNFKFFSITRTISSHNRSEQFWKQIYKRETSKLVLHLTAQKNTQQVIQGLKDSLLWLGYFFTCALFIPLFGGKVTSLIFDLFTKAFQLQTWTYIYTIKVFVTLQWFFSLELKWLLWSFSNARWIWILVDPADTISQFPWEMDDWREKEYQLEV